MTWLAIVGGIGLAVSLASDLYLLLYVVWVPIAVVAFHRDLVRPLRRLEAATVSIAPPGLKIESRLRTLSRTLTEVSFLVVIEVIALLYAPLAVAAGGVAVGRLAVLVEVFRRTVALERRSGASLLDAVPNGLTFRPRSPAIELVERSG